MSAYVAQQERDKQYFIYIDRYIYNAFYVQLYYISIDLLIKMNIWIFQNNIVIYFSFSAYYILLFLIRAFTYIKKIDWIETNNKLDQI